MVVFVVELAVELEFGSVELDSVELLESDPLVLVLLESESPSSVWFEVELFWLSVVLSVVFELFVLLVSVLLEFEELLVSDSV